MPWFLSKCFPSKRKKQQSKKTDENGNVLDGDNLLGKDGFTIKQIAKAVAIVLSGYDAEIAAASVGPPCDAEKVQSWVNAYRPPFFEEGMRCPPALISWWMRELQRRDEESRPNESPQVEDQSSSSSQKPEGKGPQEVSSFASVVSIDILAANADSK